MDKLSIFPLRRLLPNNLINSVELYRNKDVLNLFQTYCPLLMRGARHCLEMKTPEKNLITLFGFTIPAKWLTRVFLSLRQVEKILQKCSMPPEQMPYLSQVKEKWGELRVYVDLENGVFPRDDSATDQKINEIIQQLEARYAKD